MSDCWYHNIWSETSTSESTLAHSKLPLYISFRHWNHLYLPDKYNLTGCTASSSNGAASYHVVVLEQYDWLECSVCFTCRVHISTLEVIVVEIYCNQINVISNTPSFHQECPGVPDGPDDSDWTSYPLTVNQTRHVAQATGRIAYLPCDGYYTMAPIAATRRVEYYPMDTRQSGVALPLPYVRNVVTCTHQQNNTCVTLFPGAAVIL